MKKTFLATTTFTTKHGVKTMRKLMLMIAVLFGVIAFTNTSSAGVANTDHDLSINGGQVCVYCHTPHFAGNTKAPLWNRIDTTQTYTMYQSPTMDMTASSQPQGVSLACLSCHDGTLAYDQLVNVPAEPLNNDNMTSMPENLIGTDLSNDHPISLTYNTIADSMFNSATGGKVGGTLPLYGNNNDQLECATCHNVHDNTNEPFLRVNNTGSALCTTCHIK